VSKATKHHCTGTVQSQGGRVGNVKQVVFEPRPEDSYRRCGSDKIRQTFFETRAAATGKSSVTDGRQSGAADNQWRRWTETKSPTSLNIYHLTKLISKVCRCRPVKTLVHEDCIFECNPLWSLQPVQLRSGVMRWNFDDEKISQAAVFITDCSRDKRCDETPTPEDKRTRDDASDWRTDLDTNRWRQMVCSWRSTAWQVDVSSAKNRQTDAVRTSAGSLFHMFGVRTHGDVNDDDDDDKCW